MNEVERVHCIKKTILLNANFFRREKEVFFSIRQTLIRRQAMVGDQGTKMDEKFSLQLSLSLSTRKRHFSHRATFSIEAPTLASLRGLSPVCLAFDPLQLVFS